MQKTQEYITVIGLFLLVGVVVVLLSTPEDLFSKVLMLDVSRTQKTSHQTLVTSVFDFKDAEELKRLPKNISGLSAREVPFSATEERMGAIVKRLYSNGSDAVSFMLLTSSNASSFHDLHVCYSNGGKNITENKVIPIRARRLGENGYYDIYVNQLLVEKNGFEQVVLYWFMWEGGVVRAEDDYLLVEVSAPVDRDRSAALLLARDFVSDFFMRTYKPIAKSKTLAEQIPLKYGGYGYLTEVFMVLLPLLMVFNSKLKRK